MPLPVRRVLVPARAPLPPRRSLLIDQDPGLLVPGAFAFSRPSVAYLSNGQQVAAGVPRYETIDGWRGIWVEEGTTNVMGASALDFSLWARAADVILTSNQSDPFGGMAATKAVKGTTTSADPFYCYSGAKVAAGATATYTASIWARADTPMTVPLMIYLYGVAAYSLSISLTTQWQRFTFTQSVTNSLDNATSIGMGLRLANSTTVYVFRAQLESKPYATSFINGTRSAETLTIPTAGVLGPGNGFTWNQGTVEMWAYTLQEEMVGGSRPRAFLLFRAGGVSDPPGYLDFYHCVDRTLGEFLVRLGTQPYVQFSWNPPSPLFTGRHYFVLTWDRNSSAKFYVDGVLRAQASIAGKTLPIQSYASIAGDSATGWLNNLVDPLRVSSRALTDAEIAAAYEKGRHYVRGVKR